MKHTQDEVIQYNEREREREEHTTKQQIYCNLYNTIY